MKPLCVDLYAGLGGWCQGFLAEGYRVAGFDIERHRYPARDLSGGEIKANGNAGLTDTTYGGDFGWDGSAMRTGNSKSPARKAASVQIAKIPFPLAQWVARVYKPANAAIA